MRKSKNFASIVFACTLPLVFLFCFHTQVSAQNKAITVYQYRHVPADKIDEFIKRETTYWSKVAERATKAKTMTFWAVLQKVGGHDLPNSPNFLFVNTFPDIDKVDGVFNDVESAAGVKMQEMETNSLSTTTSEYFLQEQNWVQDATADPSKDFNYIVFNYQNTNYQDSMIRLEKKYWEPFILKAMNNDQSRQMAWGNAVVLSPTGANIKFTTVSYDFFKNLQDALVPVWDPKIVFPAKLFPLLDKIAPDRPGTEIYRIIKVVASSE
jgi:hypothetical protein